MRKNAKVLASVLALALIFSMFSGLGAFAGGASSTGKFYGKTDVSTAKAGDEVKVTFGFADFVNVTTGLKTVKTRISFDSNVFTYKAGSFTSIQAVNPASDWSITPAATNVLCSFNDQTPTTNMLVGDAAYIILTVNENAPKGASSTITITNADTNNKAIDRGATAPTWTVLMSAKTTSGYTATPSVLIPSDVPADPTPTVGLALTNLGNKTLTATIGNYIAAQSYQVWMEQVDSNGVGQGWVLQKTFAGAFTSTAASEATLSWNVTALTPVYRIYVRYKGADNIIYQVSKQVVIDAAATPVINALNVADETIYDGVVYATALKTFNLSVDAVCTAGMGYEWFNATSTLGTASTYAFTPSASGIYVLNVKVSNQLNGELFAVRKIKFVITDANAPFAYINANAPLVNSVSNGVVSLGLSDISKSNGNSPLFRFALAEPFKGAQMKGNFGASATGSFNVSNPGYYDAIGFISSGDRQVDEDFVIKSVNVPRTFGGYATLTTTTDLADGTYTIKGIGAGLTNGVGYQYSFWRVDANGKNLIKNWSSDDTLTWKPTRDGKYTIIVRVRGDKDNNNTTIFSANSGTFEAAKNLEFTIGSPSTFAGASLAVSASPTKRNPVTLTVNGVASDAVYAFSVYDANRGGVIIRGFAPSNEVVWVPDKPGSYIVTAKINGQASFGYADATVTANVTVGN
jgi:hypothetical protein